MQGRLIGTLAAVCALAAMPTTALASNGALDSVVGDGTTSTTATLGGTEQTNVRFSAHSGPNGENPQGFVTGTYSATSLSGQLTFPSGTFTGQVVCVNVQGNIADVMAKLDAPIMTPTGPADMIDLGVTDNGDPVGGQTVDFIGTGFYEEGTHVLGECSQSDANAFQPGRGNAVVSDAS